MSSPSGDFIETDVRLIIQSWFGALKNRSFFNPVLKKSVVSVFRTTRVTTWFTQLYLISHYSAIRAIWPLSLHPRSGFVLTLFWQIILNCLVVVSNCNHLTCSPFASAASNHKEGLPSARTRRWNSAARSHPLYEDIRCVGGGSPSAAPCACRSALCVMSSGDLTRLQNFLTGGKKNIWSFLLCLPLLEFKWNYKSTHAGDTCLCMCHRLYYGSTLNFELSCNFTTSVGSSS